MRMLLDPDAVKRHKLRPGTLRRAVPYAGRYRGLLALLLISTALHAGIVAVGPIILKFIIDDGLIPKRFDVIVTLSLVLVGLALVDVAAIYCQTWLSARVGQGLLYDLRTEVFAHVQRQAIAFFSRTQTGALVSRLNTDVIGAQQAITTLLSQATSTILTLVLVILTMAYLSWQVTLVALAMIPLFLLPTKVIGRKLQRLTRRRMELDAEMASLMNEQFNVSGAMLAKLYGKPERDAEAFAGRAANVRDVATAGMVWGQMLVMIVTVLSATTTAMVYGLGGKLAIDGVLEVGTLVALAALLVRLFGPINQLSNMHVQVMAALVSFDRIFEVLDRRPLVEDRADAGPIRVAGAADGVAPEIEFDAVSFRFPKAEDVSLASLESSSTRAPERPNDAWTLRDVSFRAPGGRLTALVGPSGAGKTTITHLVARLYDPDSGAVRIDGEDIRDVTLRSLADTVGVVTQDAHLFHDTIRANLLYARPDATERELIEVCDAARIWEVISSLPDGLDTRVGERGYRLSGGEKQRVALARLLLKSPPVVVLDEATAHLDSESERAIQRVLDTALAGRTSLVVAHRLSTVRRADQILVVDGGRIRERGTHEDLLAAGGLYAELYNIQFSYQAADAVPVDSAPAQGRAAV
ncbi:ABC transporter ATP-binding protein [Plantactinospora soyae]|uniref:ATP-binding cassette subfamily B protein n=1 Tax=Plantactinospora soyae TaxID=1544732 RepID=A0A927M9S6_9ACTN|nr:ABC transporter ATP-binding protein [Plantactinospora soyae]MBE1489186.1 ATP-binding cassette subfamily B protein [Plantactinospora soyae]